MKGAIVSVEIFAEEADASGGARRRLTLTVGGPVRSGDGWSCRVALADLHRPAEIHASDSVTALAGAMGRAREWLSGLGAQGMTLYRERTGESRFELD